MNEVFGLQNQRLKPRIEVLRGYKPDTADEFRTSLPVAFNVIILSGQLIQPKWNAQRDTYEWVLAGDSEAEPQYYWAADDSQDEDVQEAGTLPALSCSGQFVIETAYFNSDEPNVYNRSKFVTVDTDPAHRGDVRMADTSELNTVPLLAEVVEKGPYSVKKKNSNVKPFLVDNNGNLYENPGLYVIQLRTAFTPAHTHA